MIKLGQDSFKELFGDATRFTSSKTLPILSNVLFEADESGFKLSSTNLEMAFVQKVYSRGAEPFEPFCVSANLLNSFIGALPVGDVSFEVKNSRLYVEGGENKIKANFSTIAGEDFPTIPLDDCGELLSIDGGELAASIAKVITSVAKDDTRPTLCGVHVSIIDGVCYVVGADGYRLSVCKIACPEDAKCSLLLPSASAKELAKHMDKWSELFSNDNRFVAKIKRGTIVTQLLQGSFPDFLRLIPTEYKLKVSIPKDDLVSALSRASYFGTAVKLTFGRDLTVISSFNTSESENVETLTYNRLEGEDEIVIQLHTAYLRDAIHPVDGDVIMEITDNVGPCVVKSSGGHDGYTVVVMPQIV